MARRSSISLRMIGAAVAFAAMAALVQSLGKKLNGLEIVFYRSAAHLALLVPVLCFRKVNPLRGLSGLVLARSALGGLGVLCFFFSLRHMNVGLATLIQWTAPAFTLLFAVVVLRERVSALVWFFLGLAVMGIALAVEASPEIHLGARYYLVAFAGAISAGVGYGLLKKATKQANELTLAFWFSLVSLIGTSFSVKPGPPSLYASDFLKILGVGICVSGYQWLVTTAYQRGKASEVAPFSLLPPILAHALQVLILGQWPTMGEVSGTLVATLSLAGLLRQKRPSAPGEKKILDPVDSPRLSWPTAS